jgi:prepilin-type N-terminal cleavage/methylation domain-containing protein
MNQRGFTLVEVLGAMVVSGLLLTGIVLSVFQVSLGNARTRDQVITLADASFAVLWMKKDLQMAQTTDLVDGAPPVSSVTLNWTDFTTSFDSVEPQAHSSVYTLSGTELVRTYDGVPTVVGRNITSIGFSLSGNAIRVSITSTSPTSREETETLDFSVNVHMRTEDVN